MYLLSSSLPPFSVFSLPLCPQSLSTLSLLLLLLLSLFFSLFPSPPPPHTHTHTPTHRHVNCLTFGALDRPSLAFCPCCPFLCAGSIINKAGTTVVASFKTVSYAVMEKGGDLDTDMHAVLADGSSLQVGNSPIFFRYKLFLAVVFCWLTARPCRELTGSRIPAGFLLLSHLRCLDISRCYSLPPCLRYCFFLPTSIAVACTALLASQRFALDSYAYA